MTAISAAPERHWDVSFIPDPARRALLKDYQIKPGRFIEWLVSAAEAAAAQNQMQVSWEASKSRRGTHRLNASIPLPSQVFDTLINGRFGYRGQYYVSEQAGADFNRLIVDALFPVVARAAETQNLPVSFVDLWMSASREQSKIWPTGDGQPFRDAPPAELRPLRWFLAKRMTLDSMPLRAPLPKCPAIDFKGSWLENGVVWIDPEKVDRGQILHERGFV